MRELTTRSPIVDSPAPRVRITRRFDAPFSTILTAARTCYSSKGIVRDEDLKLDFFRSGGNASANACRTIRRSFSNLSVRHASPIGSQTTMSNSWS